MIQGITYNSVYSARDEIENNHYESEGTNMPPIKHSQLEEAFKDYEKKMKGKPADPELDKFNKNVKELCKDVHPINSMTETAKLTTLEQRRELYGTVQQYLNILSYPEKFDGNTKSETATVKRFKELDSVGSYLKQHLDLIYNITKFSQNAKNASSKISTISNGLVKQTKENDIQRYEDNIDKISKRSSAKNSLLTDTGSAMLSELGIFVTYVKGFGNEYADLDTKLAEKIEKRPTQIGKAMQVKYCGILGEYGLSI